SRGRDRRLIRDYSVVRCLNKRVAITEHTPRIASDHRSDATTGCCIGHAEIVDDGFGLPQSSRTAAAAALTGFQAAMVPSTVGRLLLGTNALDPNVSGNNTMRPIDCADSGSLTASPMHAPNQVSA